MLTSENPEPITHGRSAFWSLFEAIRRTVDAITIVLNMLGTVLILLLVLLINSDVIGRAVFGAPVSGVPEMVSLSIVAIVFLQISQTVGVGRLTRSDALLNILKHKWPRTRQIIEIFFNLASAALVAVLLSASLPLFEKSWRKQTFVGSVGDFTAPVWPVKLIILIGCTVLIAQFLLGAAQALMPEKAETSPLKRKNIRA